MSYILIENWPTLDEWIAELESGKWNQFSGYLVGDQDKANAHACKIKPEAQGKSYCCLGVGCMVSIGEVPADVENQTVVAWDRDWDAWVAAGCPPESEWADDDEVFDMPPENDLFVPTGHYLGAEVTLDNSTGILTLADLVVHANDGASWDGNFTQVIRVLKLFRDDVRDFTWSGPDETFEARVDA